MPKVILESSDHQSFTVDVDVAKMSTTIKTMLEDLGVSSEEGHEERIPLPNVRGEILGLVIDWSKEHQVSSLKNTTNFISDLTFPLYFPYYKMCCSLIIILGRSSSCRWWRHSGKAYRWYISVGPKLSQSRTGDSLWLDPGKQQVFLRIKKIVMLFVYCPAFILVFLCLSSLQAANYLDIKGLLDVTCKTVANMIKGKTPEEIRKTFNIRNDFTAAEEDQIRKENEWCEEK